jgi:hypothetical protein
LRRIGLRRFQSTTFAVNQSWPWEASSAALDRGSQFSPQALAHGLRQPGNEKLVTLLTMNYNSKLTTSQHH